MATELRRVCFRCGTPTELGAVFTPTLPRGRRRPRYSHWCDDCRRRAWWQPHPGDDADDSFVVTARDAARFLALAAEYHILAGAADDPVLAHRLQRAASDYRKMAARCRG